MGRCLQAADRCTRWENRSGWAQRSSKLELRRPPTTLGFTLSRSLQLRCLWLSLALSGSKEARKQAWLGWRKDLIHLARSPREPSELAIKNILSDWTITVTKIITMPLEMVKESLNLQFATGRIWAILIQLQHSRSKTISDFKTAHSTFENYFYLDNALKYLDFAI